jgi:hypothetical protein
MGPRGPSPARLEQSIETEVINREMPQAYQDPRADKTTLYIAEALGYPETTNGTQDHRTAAA